MMSFATLSKKFSSLKMLRYGSRICPVRDWLVLLVITVFILIGSAVWNALFFVSMLTDSGISAPGVHHAAPERAAIDVVEEAFVAREAEQERYRNEYRFVDPAR